MDDIDAEIERSSRFRRLLENRPKAGDILESSRPVSVTVEFDSSLPRNRRVAMYVYAAIDEVDLKWKLTSESKGLICFIIRADHDKLIKKVGGFKNKSKVVLSRVRVLKYNHEQTAAICEVV